MQQSNLDTKPKVSVIIPLYNRKNYISSCIQSVLNQSYRDYELIILDDGSTDGSDLVVSSFTDTQVKLFKNEGNKGISYTRNRLNSLARGEYVAVLDSDDLAEPDRLAKQVAFLDEHPNIDLVAGCAKIIDAQGNATGTVWGSALSPEKVYAFLPLGNQIIHSTVMARRSFFLDFPFNEQLRTAEDYDVWLRGNNHCNYTVLADIVSSYRLHQQSISNEEEEGINMNAAEVKLSYLKSIVNVHINSKMVHNIYNNFSVPLYSMNEAYKFISAMYHSSPKRTESFEKEWKETFTNIWLKCLYRVRRFEPKYLIYIFSSLSKSITLKEKLKYIFKCLTYKKNPLIK